MASALIHISIAKELNKYIKKNERELLLGSIAPDVGKHIGIPKEITHFRETFVNLDKFLEKYKSKLDDPFILGYYIHLYTDYLWFKYFITEIRNQKLMILKNGKKLEYDQTLFDKLIYNDYTNLNIELIDTYNLDLSLFYEEIPKLKEKIDEIPEDKLPLLLEKMGLIIINTKLEKEYFFDMSNIYQFINTSIKIILGNLEELKIYNP